MTAEYLSREDELALIVRAKTGDKAAIEALLDNFAGCLHKMAGIWHRKYVFGQCEYEDCFQAACMGVMKAIDKFDVASGNALMTLSYILIRQSLQEMQKTMDVIRRPRHSRRRTTSLNVSVEDGASELQDICAVAPHVDVSSRLTREDEHAKAESLLRYLTTRERAIMLLHYGGSTFEEIASQFGVTKQRIHQVISKSLHKLKKIAYSLGITDDDGRLRRSSTSCPHCHGDDIERISNDQREFRCNECDKQFLPASCKRPRRIRLEESVSSEGCPKCGSLDIVKRGFDPRGKQRIRCKKCWSSSIPSQLLTFGNHRTYDDVEPFFSQKLHDYEICEILKMNARDVAAFRREYESSHGATLCPCGRRMTHRGFCEYRLNRSPKCVKKRLLAMTIGDGRKYLEVVAMKKRKTKKTTSAVASTLASKSTVLSGEALRVMASVIAAFAR
jgi:RNA polymerase sigma factor (sigma-70 family)